MNKQQVKLTLMMLAGYWIGTIGDYVRPINTLAELVFSLGVFTIGYVLVMSLVYRLIPDEEVRK